MQDQTANRWQGYDEIWDYGTLGRAPHHSSHPTITPEIYIILLTTVMSPQSFQ